MTSEQTGEVRRLTELLPGEIDQYLSGGGDLAIVPIGSIEQHGPHLLLGCDSYISVAKAQEVARISGGVLFPLVSFSWVGCTNAFSGGIGVRAEVYFDYLRAVVRAIHRAGFRRIVLLNSHGGNFYAMRAFPQVCLREDGIVVLTVYGAGGSEEARRISREAGGGEGTGLTGALRLLGREDLVQDVLEYNRKAIAEFGDQPKVQHQPDSFRQARRLGVVGLDYFHECLHVQPDSRISPEAGIEYIRKAAEHIAAHLPALSRYLDETEGATTPS